MSGRNDILNQIVSVGKSVLPQSGRLVLYGSQARGDDRPDGDILILLDGEGDRLTLAEEDVIRWPLYELELKSGVLISPLIMLKKNWYGRPIKSPFYYNVMREGIRL